jgi:predicted DNA-binding transcriptional regulator AlpA
VTSAFGHTGVEAPAPRLSAQPVGLRPAAAHTTVAGHRASSTAWDDVLDPLWTTRDVAVVTRSPESTVRYWRHLGHGPRSFKLGRRVVYKQSEVLAWVEQQAAA